MRASLVAVFASAAGLALTPAPADTPLRGFFAQSIQAERDLETRFKSMPDAALKLDALCVRLDRLNALQETYARSWKLGTLDASVA